jgi:hypothetical protein
MERLHVFGMIGILAMPSGTGENAYSTRIQKHLPGDVEQAFGLCAIPDSFCAARFLGQNPKSFKHPEHMARLQSRCGFGILGSLRRP